ncbi:MAG: 50S ribosomal protein L25 [Haliscomenobacteraceae bacterium CHB4]|nr:50S ribosomal protein L25 [Saprospiraceae bacterium]MCE7921428.1 50S ribosomal protein L25 [Haliscomenobacteraceae bacterium CHB4]
MEIIALQGHRKESSGKEGTRKIRNNDQVPAIMYKSGGGEAIQFALNQPDVRHLIYTSKFKLAEIALNGQSHKCIVKDIQFHPVTDAVLHVDFLELVPGVKFKATVPLRFAGQAPGVKEGGKFIPRMRQVNILTTPEKVVDEVIADISAMELGSTIRVRDITPTEGVEITNTGAVPIASIEIPRALKGSAPAK